MKNTTCCFVSNRYRHLPWKYRQNGIRFLIAKFKLLRVIKNAIRQGYDNFVTGIAIGADMLFADLVLKQKQKHSHIKLQCVGACKNQHSLWSDNDILHYTNILHQADSYVLSSHEPYFNGCLAVKNKHLIQCSSMMIALYNGDTNSTTYHSIVMAQLAKLSCIIIRV